MGAFTSKRSWGAWALLFVLMGITGWGGKYGYEKWQLSRPTEENFDLVLRELWDKQQGTGGRTFGEGRPKLCIATPMYPAPDARSKSQNALAWHMDFFRDLPPAPARQTQLLQLDALAKVGLLEKTQHVVVNGTESREVDRYRLSDKGWASSSGGRNDACFAYGETRYLGIKSFEPKVMDSKSGLDIYLVKGKTGLSSQNEIEAWARDPQIQAAFPEIGKRLAGEEFGALLVRGRGKWVDYQTLLREQAVRSNPEMAQLPPMELSTEAKREMEMLGSLPAPTVEEVKKLLRTANHDGEVDAFPSSCLYLPGQSQLPVDKDLSRRRPNQYAVAIFTNKTRTPYDQVAKKTIPYIERLEQLGVLVKRTQQVQGEGKDAATLFEANVYELPAVLQTYATMLSPSCLSLGAATVEFVDVQVTDKNLQGLPESSFRYKLKVLYKNPPVWAKEPVLASQWDDLRGALERGKACSGQFGFDRKTRTSYGGAGSCWWAYDSVGEGS